MRPTLHIKRKTITPKLLKKYTLLLIISFPPSFSFPLVFQPLISITNSNALSLVLQFIQLFFFFFVFLCFANFLLMHHSSFPTTHFDHKFQCTSPISQFIQLFFFFFFFCIANFLLMHHSKYIKYVKINLII